MGRITNFVWNLIDLKKFEVGHYLKYKDKYYRVAQIEPFVAIKNYGTAPALLKAGPFVEEALTPKSQDVLYSIVAVPLTNVKIKFRLPQATDRFVLEGMTYTGFLDGDDLDDVNSVFRLYIPYGYRVAFEVENPNNINVDIIIKWYGFKYVLEEVTTPEALQYVRKLEAEGKLPEIRV